MPWQVSLATGLPTSDSEDWDGSAAAGSIFAWAGWPDNPDPAKAGKGFIWRNTDDPDLKGSFKAPVARVIDGTLTVIKGGVRAAKSRGPQADIPQDVKDRGLSRLNSAYWSKYEEEAAIPAWFHRRPDPDRLEFRAATVDTTEDGFTGYAATFMTADSYWTAFAKGAFRKSVRDRGDRLPVLWQHDPDWPIGRHVGIKEDRDGLFIDVHLIDDGAEGSVALKRLRGGVPLGLSFGFQTVKDRSADDDDTIDLAQLPNGVSRDDIRIITEVRLWETSVVTFPANESAAITAVRSGAETDALSVLLDAIRTGHLPDAQYAQIVAAWQARDGAGAGSGHSTSTDAQARRRYDVEVALARHRYAGLLSGVQA